MNRLIGFFSDGLPFDGDTINYHALGGSESAVYYMAKELHSLGNEIKVICNCENPGVYDGVQYIHKRDFKYLALTTDFDVFILSRFYNFFQVSFKSKLNILWNHDMLDNKFGLLKYLPKIDVLFNLSDFHMNNYITKIPELKSMIWQTRNGIDLEAVNQSVKGVKRNPGKMIYASRPERGLQILLESIWPRLLEIFPHLELCICGYAVGGVDVAANVKDLYAHIDRLIKETPRVFHLGSLSKSEYYSHLAESQLMLYPCDFPEISCIVALEAQACRTPIVTTNDFALTETVGVKEWLINGRPVQRDYQDSFINRVTELLTNRSLYKKTAQRGYQWVRSRYTWRSIAKEWDGFFEKYLKEMRFLRRKNALNGSTNSEVKHLRQNLKVLSKNAAHLARKIEDAKPTGDIQVVMAKSGLPVLKNHIALHSLIDPEKEARDWAHRIEISEAIEGHKKMAVFGFGMGYHVKALLNLDCPSVTVIEPDPAVLRVAFEWIDFSTSLEKITLVSGYEEVPDLINLHLVPHQPTVRLHKNLYSLWKEKIKSSRQLKETIADMMEALKDNEEIVQFLKTFSPNEPVDIDKLVEKIPRDQAPLKDWQTVFFLMKELSDR